MGGGDAMGGSDAMGGGVDPTYGGNGNGVGIGGAMGGGDAMRGNGDMGGGGNAIGGGDLIGGGVVAPELAARAIRWPGSLRHSRNNLNFGRRRPHTPHKIGRMLRQLGRGHDQIG